MKKVRKRIQKMVVQVEIVSSTAFALSKNPDMYKNVHLYEPDQKKVQSIRLERIEQIKQDKFNDIENKIKEAMRNLRSK